MAVKRRRAMRSGVSIVQKFRPFETARKMNDSSIILYTFSQMYFCNFEMKESF